MKKGYKQLLDEANAEVRRFVGEWRALPAAFGEIIVNIDPADWQKGGFQIVIENAADLQPEIGADEMLRRARFSGANEPGAIELEAWCEAGAGERFPAFCEAAHERYCRVPQARGNCPP